MKLERKHKTRIVLGIAALFILYGLLDMKLKFNVNPKTVSNVSLVLMLIAFGLLFSGRKTNKDSSSETESKNQLQDNPDKTEIDSSTQTTEVPLGTSDYEQGTNLEVNSTDVKPDEQNKQVDQKENRNT